MSNRDDPLTTAPQKPIGPPNPDRRTTGLDDPRALDILTTEHWSLLSTRALGYQEMFGRTTIFVAILSGTVVALALLAQATDFRRETLWFALMLISVALFIGLATFVRSVAINYEDARWVTGMNLLRRAYLRIVPELEPFFVTGHEPDADGRDLAEGSPQRLANLVNSLTTTSGVVAALNSLLTGALASDLGALFGGGAVLNAAIGAGASLVSAALHVRYAARFRRSHAPLPGR
jgi:type III secretory pathway component EscS